MISRHPEYPIDRTFGNKPGGNYAQFNDDGTFNLYGNATCFRDEFSALIGSKLESPASDIVTDVVEGAVTFKKTAALADYVTMPVQINHDAKAGADVFPHIHWWQTTSATPNWLIQYRWQVNGSAKTTAWTSKKYVSSAFTYVSGTLNQITTFGVLTPPTGAGVSTILQIRIIRDYANGSTLFTGTDPLNASVDATFLDVHIEIDTFGSKEEYTK